VTIDCGVSQCGAPTQDRICRTHLNDLVTVLRHFAGGDENLLVELETTATRQAQLGSPVGVKTRGGGEKPVFFLESASTLLGDIRRELLYWGALAADTWTHLQRRDRGPRDIAAWLASVPGLLAGLEGVEVMHARMVAFEKHVWRIIDAPRKHVYLGNCASEVEDGSECPRYLYAPLANDGKPPAFIRCPGCRASVDVVQRQRDLVARACAAEGTAAEVSRVLARIGIPVQPATVRGYARDRMVQGKLYPARIRVVEATEDGHPLYNIRECLDVYMASEAKRGKAA